MAKVVTLFANLGSPDSPSTADVRTYLREFLMDERVIDIPYIPRYLLVNGIIAPFRAYSSAKKYKTIWTPDGSPLILLTQQLVEAYKSKYDQPAYMCMRYANPTPGSVLEQIRAENPDLERIVLFPLYPHYAMSSYETAVLHVQAAFDAMKDELNCELDVVPPFFDHPAYIRALSDSLAPHIKEDNYILFSYHGIPERHLAKTDPSKAHCLKYADCCDRPSEMHQYCYRHQVMRTTEDVAKELDLPKERYHVSFQSRLGRDKWLEPFTAATLASLPKSGIKKLVVICPAFVSDCLETLEEIHEEGQEIFMEAGGEEFTTVPCLNISDQWVAAIGQIIKDAEARS